MTNDKRVAKRYAKVFLHDNVGKEALDILADEVKSVVSVIETDKGAKEFFYSPIYPREQKLEVVRNFANKLGLSKHTMNIFELLINKDRISIMSSVAEELKEISDRMNGRVRVKLTTAYEPSIPELKEISERVNKFFGRKAVIERVIDNSILGGFIIEGDGKLIDMSIKGQIKRILSKV